MYLFWRFGVKISFHNDLMDNNIIGITMKAGFVINVIIIFFRCLLFWIQIPDILFSFAPKICQKYLLTPVQCLDKLKACQCLLFFDQFVRVQTQAWLFILSTAELQLCRRTSKYKNLYPMWLKTEKLANTPDTTGGGGGKSWIYFTPFKHKYLIHLHFFPSEISSKKFCAWTVPLGCKKPQMVYYLTASFAPNSQRNADISSNLAKWK